MYGVGAVRMSRSKLLIKLIKFPLIIANYM